MKINVFWGPVWSIFTDFSEERAVSIFRMEEVFYPGDEDSTLLRNASLYPEGDASVYIYKTTWLLIPEVSNLVVISERTSSHTHSEKHSK
jgi:hypothetical protein